MAKSWLNLINNNKNGQIMPMWVIYDQVGRKFKNTQSWPNYSLMAKSQLKLLNSNKNDQTMTNAANSSQMSKLVCKQPNDLFVAELWLKL